MFSKLIAGTAITGFPVAGLLIFFVFTLAVYWWTFHPKRKALLASMSSMALDEGTSDRSKHTSAATTHQGSDR